MKEFFYKPYSKQTLHESVFQFESDPIIKSSQESYFFNCVYFKKCLPN